MKSFAMSLCIPAVSIGFILSPLLSHLSRLSHSNTLGGKKTAINCQDAGMCANYPEVFPLAFIDSDIVSFSESERSTTFSS